MAAYGLTGRFLQHVDRHLGIPLIQFLSAIELFNEVDVAKAKYELVRCTDMYQVASELYQTAFLGQGLPNEL